MKSFSDETAQMQDEHEYRLHNAPLSIPAASSLFARHCTPAVILNAIFLAIIAALVFSLVGVGNLHAWVIILCTGGIIINSQYSK